MGIPVIRFNHRYDSYTAHVTVATHTFVIKASTLKEWNCIVDQFENLTDVLDRPDKVVRQLTLWKAIPLLSSMAHVLLQDLNSPPPPHNATTNNDEHDDQNDHSFYERC